MRTIATTSIIENTQAPSTNGHAPMESPANNALPETEARPTPTEDAADDIENIHEEELELLNAIYKTTVESINLARRERQLVKELEDIREELESSKSLKQSLVNDLPETLLKMRDGLDVDLDQETAPTPDSDSEPKIDDGWKSEKTSTICNDIPRFGDKKILALCDAFPTLGELNDCRVQAINERKHFSDLLPSGIGKSIGDHLAERLIAAETGFDTPPASEQVKENQPETIAEEESSDPEVDTVVNFENWVLNVADELRAKIDADVDAYTAKTNDDAWDQGYLAFQNNAFLTDAPSNIVIGKTVDWIRGWLFAEREEKQVIKEQQAEEAKESKQEDIYEDVADYSENESESDQYANALDSIAAELKSETDLSFVEDGEVWHEGYEYGLDDQPIEACPKSYGGEIQRDWIRGWIEGSTFGNDI